jgi:adenylyltransferase and sulfurtransferase
MARYLVSDAAVCSGKPLISAAALRTDGQLYVLNYPPFRSDRDKRYQSGSCYRCIHPTPPPAETLVSCSEGGVLGPVVGTMGVLMATEAIKMLTSHISQPESIESVNGAPTDTGNIEDSKPPTHFMLLYSAFASPPFRSIKIRGRKWDCAACSPDACLRSIDAKALRCGAIDYAVFCGQTAPVNMLTPDARMEPKSFETHWSGKRKRGQMILLDTRDETQFEICSIPGSINVPLERLKSEAPAIADQLRDKQAQYLIAVCRFGNDSQVAAKYLQEELSPRLGDVWIGDIKGGLEAWRRDVDPGFPEY